jgi:hypothetical protein
MGGVLTLGLKKKITKRTTPRRLYHSFAFGFEAQYQGLAPFNMTTHRKAHVSYEQWSVQFDSHLGSTAGLSPEQTRLARDQIARAYVYSYCGGRLPGQDEMRKILFKMLFGTGPRELLQLGEDLIEVGQSLEKTLESTDLAELPRASHSGLPSELLPIQLPLLPKYLRRCGGTLRLQVKLLGDVGRRLLPDRKLTQSRLLALLAAKVEAHTKRASYALIQALLEAGYAAHGTQREKDSDAVRKRLERFKKKHPDEWKEMQRVFGSNRVPVPAHVLGKSALSIPSLQDE